MNATVDQSRYLLTLAESILDGLDDSHRALEPLTGTKTAGWLVGHLAVSGDYARRLCGRAPLCPASWAESYRPGSVPSDRPDDYPSMSTLIDAIRSVYRDLCMAVVEAESEALEAPNPYEPAADAFPTVRDFVAYLMTGHLGYHFGQLTAWRAAAGIDTIRGRDPMPV